MTAASYFPTLDMGSLDKLRYIQWAGRFMHDRYSHGSCASDLAQHVVAGPEGGPLVLFSADAWRAGLQNSGVPTLVLSSADQHLAAAPVAHLARCQRLEPAGKCDVVAKTDFQGNDLHQLNTSDYGACCAACWANPQCTCFSYADPSDPQYGSMCWLKTSTAGATASSHTSGVVCEQRGGGVGGLGSGVQGYVQDIPANFSISFVLHPGGRGENNTVNGAMAVWGETMRRAYPRQQQEAAADLMTTRLGVWTDNGGYFSGRNPLTTEDAQQLYGNLSEAGVQIGYLQLDPYWYRDAWVPRQDLFPAGLGDLSRRALNNTPLLLYSNFWHQATAALYNNSYDFEYGYCSGTDKPPFPVVTVAAHDSRRFYSDIIAPYAAAGVMGAFEVDFVDYMYLLTPSNMATVDAADVWARGMVEGARAHGQSTQLCMGLPNFAMWGIGVDGLSNMRASEDDFPTNEHRWKIAYTNLFLGAIGLRPFMDVVWTSAVQPGNSYGVAWRDNVELDFVVAVLSGGPVGIGDGIGLTNATLVREGVGAKGGSEILGVGSAGGGATPLDRMFWNGSVVGDGTGGEMQLWQARVALDIEVVGAAVGAGVQRVTAYVVLAVDVDGEVWLREDDLYPEARFAGGGYVYGRRSSSSTGGGGGAWAEFGGPTLPLIVGSGGVAANGSAHAFEVYTVAPRVGAQDDGGCGGLALLGEVGKIVRLSPVRFVGTVRFWAQPGNCSIEGTVRGEQGEAVQVEALIGGAVRGVRVVVGESGVGSFVVR